MTQQFHRPASLAHAMLDTLREDVLALAATRPRGGARLPPEDQLARQYGVSERTVREAIGVLVYDRLVERRHGSGTYTCDLQAAQHVAILIQPQPGRSPSNGDVGRFHLFRHVMKTLKAANRQTRCYWPWDEQRHSRDNCLFECPDLLAQLQRGMVAGIVGIAVKPHESWFTLAEKRHIPLVGTNSAFPYCATIDVPRLIAKGVAHLAQRGAHRLALLAWSDPQKPDAPDWQGVFKATLAAHNLPYDPNWVRVDHSPFQPAAGWEGFREIWSTSRVKPDGLLVCDDILYADAAAAISDLGIQADRQLHVVSTANSDVPFERPFPTSLLMLDTQGLGRELAQLFLQAADNGTSMPKQTLLTHRLVPAEQAGWLIADSVQS